MDASPLLDIPLAGRPEKQQHHEVSIKLEANRGSGATNVRCVGVAGVPALAVVLRRHGTRGAGHIAGFFRGQEGRGSSGPLPPIDGSPLPMMKLYRP